jgi:hypothetical protein
LLDIALVFVMLLRIALVFVMLLHIALVFVMYRPGFCIGLPKNKLQ